LLLLLLHRGGVILLYQEKIRKEKKKKGCKLRQWRRPWVPRDTGGERDGPAGGRWWQSGQKDEEFTSRKPETCEEMELSAVPWPFFFRDDGGMRRILAGTDGWMDGLGLLRGWLVRFIARWSA